MSDMIMEHMRQTYEQQQAMYEQQRSIMLAIQEGMSSPTFSITAPTAPASEAASSQRHFASASVSNPRAETESISQRHYQSSPTMRLIHSCSDRMDGDLDEDDDNNGEAFDHDDDRADLRIMQHALEETRSVLSDPFATRRGSSVAPETSYTGSDGSASEHSPRYQRRLSNNPNQKVTFATAGDYLNVIAQFAKKPEEDYTALLQDYNERAKAFLKQKKYDLAEENLIQAIQIARDRQKFYGADFNENEMQDLLGQIYLQAKRFQKALGVWVELLPRVNDADQVITLRHCHRFHLVAEVFYRMWKDKKQRGQEANEDLFDALKNADSAYNKRCETIGKAEARLSPEVRLSANLLGRIHEALGNSAEAKFYYTRADGISDPGLDRLDLAQGIEDGELADGQRATTELYKAIKENNVPRALALLKNKDLEFDLERSLSKEMSKFKLTILMLAFDAGSEPVVKVLLERNADIGAKDTRGRTVVHRAAASGDAAMAYLAVRSGRKGSLEQKDKYGLTPLLLAVAENNEGVMDVVEALLIEEANIDAVDDNQDTILHFAARNSSRAISSKSPRAPTRAYELLRHLVTHPRFVAPINSVNDVGNTPLMLACENGHALTAELLLRQGANVNAKNHDGQSALFLAVDDHPVIPSYEDTVRTLLQYGAETVEQELPKKWKDFRHLSHKSLAMTGSSTEQARSGSRDSDPLSPARLLQSSTARRESGASKKSVQGAAGRKDSVSTTNTATSKGSSRMSRMFSWTSQNRG